MVECPICQRHVGLSDINEHIDSSCQQFITATLSSEPSSAVIQYKNWRCRAISTNPKQKIRQDEPKNPENPSLLLPAKRTFKRTFSQQEPNTAGKPNFAPTTPKNAAKRRKPDVAPLADRVRPHCFDDIVGQDSLVGPDGSLRQLVEQDNIPNMILWGGSGTGKTTIARIIALMSGRNFYEINSSMTATTEFKNVVSLAVQDSCKGRKNSIVFCDEVHRITRPQQDIFLDAIRSNKITLIGATTENPSLNIHHTLVYRCKVLTLVKPTDNDLSTILRRAVGLQSPQPSYLLDDEFIQYVASFADGDSRIALNLLEIAADLSKRDGITKEALKHSLTKSLLYDRSGDQHYDTISALHKSIRGSDPDAALYYLARMLKSGENPLFIARRLVVATSEDIGLADNTLQIYATSVYSLIEKLGIQDAQASLAQLVITMCLSKKSTRSYRGLNNAFAALKEPGISDAPIPFHLLDRSPELLKEADERLEGDCYQGQENVQGVPECLPEALKGRQFLEDTDFLFKRDPDLTL
ncbi:werner helicase interacting protein [Penicillium canescens]|nr:werner helicase interacting protein [Penicillium canescens]KAJ6075901.1 werner helicase interacting protein [Penicillium canescens]KAJ6158212.1 werner helicase interacting protein [Penicillium canescens]